MYADNQAAYNDLLAFAKEHRPNCCIVDNELKDVNAQLKLPATKKDATLRGNLRDQKESCEIHLKHVDLLRKGVLMDARSREAHTALTAWFRERTGSTQPLPVFCVSAKSYLERIRPDEERSFARAGLEAATTQIPALRQYLVSDPTLPSSLCP
jgi:hypothetical protein